MSIVVEMSGGVDSSVAAALLVEAGHEVIGVHMKLHDASPGTAGHCCGYDDALDARRVADRLDIPFYVTNLKDAFQRAVMDDLADTYLAGATPSPCIRCNGVLKFRILLARARSMGASHLATGHYARVVDGPHGAQLAQAVDRAKDQSYFLFPVTRSALERAIFPLGELDKSAVRAHARRLDLLTADKPESQEICFIPDDDHAAFIRAHRPGTDGSGEIVDEDGTVLGHHDGYYRFTVGQRRGLAVSLGVPAFVLRIEPETCRVVVTTGTRRLDHLGLVLASASWLERPEPDRTVEVRVRHRGIRVPCSVGTGSPATVSFHTPIRAVAPGQAAVFYDGDRVLGGGWIQRALLDHPRTEAVA